MRGITLIEIVLVLGLATMLITLSIGPGIGSFSRKLLVTDSDYIATLYRHARARSLQGPFYGVVFSTTTNSVLIESSGIPDEVYPLMGKYSALASGSIQFFGTQGATTGSLQIHGTASGTSEIEVTNTGAIYLERSL